MNGPHRADAGSGGARLLRREFLRAGAGLGALALGDLLARDARAARAAAEPPPWALPTVKAKRVIWLFMAGAPSQFELFEPKETLQRLDGQVLPPSLAAGKRFAFIDGTSAKLLGTRRKFAQHGACGAPVSELLPHTARIVDKLTFLRGVRGKEINHGPAKTFINTGFGPGGRPAFGAWSLYGLGSDAQDLPGFVVLRSGNRGPRGGAQLWGNGFLPTQFAGTPLRPSGAPVLDLDTPPGVTEAGQRAFFDAVRDLDRLGGAEGDPELEARIGAYELAHRMQSSAPDLVDLSSETAETRALYGLADDAPSFGRNCLLARRLVERGVRFVQLYHTDWDHHGDPGNHLGEPLEKRCKEVDQAAAALVVDLERRGLLEDTLVIFAGEFGRTPLGEVRDFIGRDHHIEAFTLWLAGGGVKPGFSYGETDEIGFAPVAGAMDVHDLHATLLHLMGVDHERLTFRFQGRDYRLTDVHGRVIRDFLA
ncbi:MAG: DUF1501 domain-containing protein [Planctomycetota bacterium]